jgi:hypothetical protein
MESASIHRREAISSWHDQGHGGELEEAGSCCSPMEARVRELDARVAYHRVSTLLESGSDL